MSIRVSIIIPTQRRPEGLERAAASVLAQQGVDPDSVELVIADNDVVCSARRAAARIRKRSPFKVVYVHEPKPGVASIRNAALTKASGALIAFLDDDEEASPTWLASLMDAQSRFEADVVFGPVHGRAPPSAGDHRPYLQSFFSRHGPARGGLIDHFYGCGNSLVRRAALPDPKRPFSAKRDRIGGEDDLLFAVMTNAGARFAWAPEAFVWEDPAPERLSLRYTIARAFAYGQGPTSHCAAMNPPDRIGVIRWMVVGLGQAVVFGALALVKWTTHAPDRAEALDRAARGLGKTFWWGPFKIGFYGRPT